MKYNLQINNLPIILFLLLIALISCKKETRYQMQILIKNETEAKQSIQVFPKSAYLMANNVVWYMNSGLGDGDYGKTEFEIDQGDSESLFLSSDVNQKPYELVLRIFDSIYVIQSDSNIIKFYPDTMVAYTENIFFENTTWEYKKVNSSEKTNFSSQPIEGHNYSFVISLEK